MPNVAEVWTEGKTDVQHLRTAAKVLGKASFLRFNDPKESLGDDQLLKQCIAFARTPQPNPVVFVFDRDKPDTLKRVVDSHGEFKNWGNNVFSFALPIPTHRQHDPWISIEHYYLDEDLKRTDKDGRRLYLASEFNPKSGRCILNPDLSVGNKGLLDPNGQRDTIIDKDVFNSAGDSVARSKAAFASYISQTNSSFDRINFDAFLQIFELLERILLETRPRHDVTFYGMETFENLLSELEAPEQLAVITETCLRIFKVAMLTFIAMSVRYLEPALLGESSTDKKIRAIRDDLNRNFAHPTIGLLETVVRHCFYALDDSAPRDLRRLRDQFASVITLGAIGDLLDTVEGLFPAKPTGRVRNRRDSRKQILSDLMPAFGELDGKIGDIADAATQANLSSETVANLADAVRLLAENFSGLRDLTYRVKTLDRARTGIDELEGLLTTYSNNSYEVEELTAAFQDVPDTRSEIYEVLLDSHDPHSAVDVYPFLIIRDHRVHFYSQIRAKGYAYIPVVGDQSVITFTRRQFSQSIFSSSVAPDQQALFWTQVIPSVSPAGVRSNIPIPPHRQSGFIGRKPQLSTIMQEIVEIPNQHGVIYGLGGVGKTALLIELTTSLAASPNPNATFNNIIWVSAKQDFYDPLFEVIERADPQFDDLDGIFNVILAFHEFEGIDRLTHEEKKSLLGELLRDGTTLLILDNFETVAGKHRREILHFFGVTLKQILRESPSNCKVIVTSREKIVSGFHAFELQGLNKRDAKILMNRLFEPYKHTAGSLTESQQNQLFEASKGIPLVIKHAYAQVFEYNRSLGHVIERLSTAGSQLVEFSFAEVLKSSLSDELQKQVLLAMHLRGKPMRLRQIATIVDATEEQVDEVLTRLTNYQCVDRTNFGDDHRFEVSKSAEFFPKRLVTEFPADAATVRKRIAGLSLEDTIDYSTAEYEAVTNFNLLLQDGVPTEAEEALLRELRRVPDSVLLNIYYARFLHNRKYDPEGAIARLERVRLLSGNHPIVLRDLVRLHLAIENPNYESAHAFAETLKNTSEDPDVLRVVAEFYVRWSTALLLKGSEIDPLRELQRQQMYKEMADNAVALLQKIKSEDHHWYYLVAQAHTNRWDYGAAIRHIDLAIANLPHDSYNLEPYSHLRSVIISKRMKYGDRK